MKYIIASFIIISLGVSLAAFTPPSGSPVYDPDQTAAVALNTAAREAMGNWAWVQDGTNLIAVYTP